MRRRANGEGSVYQRKDGRWVAALCLANNKRKSIYRRTKAEAAMALHFANQAKMQGTLVSTRNQTVEEFFTKWLLYRVQPRVRERTYKSYRDVVNKHVFPHLSSLQLQRLHPEHLQELYELKRKQGYAPRTVRHLHCVMHQALNEALFLHHISYNICTLVHPPNVPKEESHVQALTVEQARRFLAVAHGDTLEALYVLALTTGMRQGELLALTWDDINFTTGQVHVQHSLNRSDQGLQATTLKTASSRRCIQLTSLALDALKRHALQQEQEKQLAGSRWANENWVFCSKRGTPLQVSDLRRRSFHPLLVKAGLPSIRFHDLRHSTATLLFTLGTHPKIVQELLGHGQIYTTLDIYSHVLPTLQEAAIQRLEELLSPLQGKQDQ